MHAVDNAPQVHSNLDFTSAPVSSQSCSLAGWLGRRPALLRIEAGGIADRQPGPTAARYMLIAISDGHRLTSCLRGLQAERLRRRTGWGRFPALTLGLSPCHSIRSGQASITSTPVSTVMARWGARSRCPPSIAHSPPEQACYSAAAPHCHFPGLCAGQGTFLAWPTPQWTQLQGPICRYALAVAMSARNPGLFASLVFQPPSLARCYNAYIADA